MATLNGTAAPSTNGHANRGNKAKFVRNPTSTYRPGGAWWGYPTNALDGNPVFTWFDIPRMLRDPRIRFVERMWRAPFQRVKWTVKAESSQVAKFVDATLRRFWRNSLPKILSRYFRYGYAPGGAEFVIRKGRVRLDRVRVVEPRDAQPLIWTKGASAGKAAGFILQSNGGTPGSPPHSNQRTWVQAPHAFWFAGYGEYGPWFDSPPLSGAFEPWLEKRGRNGAIHARRLWFRKCAFRGGTMYHPAGTSRVGPEDGGTERNNQDIAREMMEYAESGNVFTFENAVNSGIPGEYAWKYIEPSAQPDVKGVREYPQDLDSEMLEGVGIPRDALESTEVGSGWSGKVIPLMGFLGGVDELAGLLMETADAGWLRHAVAVNYGPSTWYEIEAQSLAEEVQQAAKGGKGGSEGPNPLQDLFSGQPPKPQGGGQPRQMSWSAYTGPNGGKGWKNDQTGETRYQPDQPRDSADGKPDASASPDSPHPHADSKAQRIIRAIKNLPKRAVKKARAKVSDAYSRLEARYGPGYARVIVGAGVAGLPIPLPGASAMMAAPVLAVAELHRRLSKWNSPVPEQIDHEGVVKPAARWFLGRVFGRLRSALHLSWMDSLELSTFDEGKHPRDDHGRFVSHADLQQARTDPNKAAELRARVTDPEQRSKLNAALDDKDHTKHKTDIIDRADELIKKVAQSVHNPNVKLTADEMRELAASLPRLSLPDLRRARNAMRADFAHGKADQTKRDLVPKLVDQANRIAARLEKPVETRDPSEVANALLGRDEEPEPDRHLRLPAANLKGKIAEDKPLANATIPAAELERTSEPPPTRTMPAAAQVTEPPPAEPRGFADEAKAKDYFDKEYGQIFAVGVHTKDHTAFMAAGDKYEEYSGDSEGAERIRGVVGTAKPKGSNHAEPVTLAGTLQPGRQVYLDDGLIYGVEKVTPTGKGALTLTVKSPFGEGSRELDVKASKSIPVADIPHWDRISDRVAHPERYGLTKPTEPKKEPDATSEHVANDEPPATQADQPPLVEPVAPPAPPVPEVTDAHRALAMKAHTVAKELGGKEQKFAPTGNYSVEVPGLGRVLLPGKEWEALAAKKDQAGGRALIAQAIAKHLQDNPPKTPEQEAEEKKQQEIARLNDYLRTTEGTHRADQLDGRDRAVARLRELGAR